MRFHSLAAALLLSASLAFAQDTSRANRTDTVPAKVAMSASARARLQAQLSVLRLSGYTAVLPTADQFTEGNQTIPVTTTATGPIGVVNGNLDVFGTIDGTTMVIDGTLRVHPGATIKGDAIAVRGRIQNLGGIVTGETRSLGTFATGDESKRQTTPHTTIWALKLALGWFAVLVIIGVGVMIFAESNLDGVVLALERGIGKSFAVGLLGQVLAMPALVVLCVALGLTIIGILLIPFAIVAYTIAMAGLVTLGFLAVARLSGLPLVKGEDLTVRGVSLRALFVGLIGYFALWTLAAAFTWHPLIGAVLRVIALCITWVAATAGLGATMLSRAGTQRPGRRRKGGAAPDDYSWQTPTPVSGVAATRRKASL
jgi:hypothetical protein